DRLKEAIAQSANAGAATSGPSFPEPFEREIDSLAEAVAGPVPRFLLRRLLLDVGGYTEKRFSRNGTVATNGGAGRTNGHTIDELVTNARQRLAAGGCAVPGIEARTRYAWIRRATAGCVQRPARRPRTWTDRLDRIFTHPLWGTLVFLALMFVVFE